MVDEHSEQSITEKTEINTKYSFLFGDKLTNNLFSLMIIHFLAVLIKVYKTKFEINEFSYIS